LNESFVSNEEPQIEDIKRS